MTTLSQQRPAVGGFRSKAFALAALILAGLARSLTRKPSERPSMSIEPTRVDELPAREATKETVAELSLKVLAQHQITEPLVRVKAIALGDAAARNFIVLANCKKNVSAERARAIEQQLSHELSFGMDARLRGLYWRQYEA